MTTKRPHKVLALCKDYNGYKNVFFMMKSDDFRLHDERWGYVLVDNSPVYSSKTQTLSASDGRLFKVFEDWSLKLIGEIP